MSAMFSCHVPTIPCSEALPTHLTQEHLQPQDLNDHRRLCLAHNTLPPFVSYLPFTPDRPILPPTNKDRGKSHCHNKMAIPSNINLSLLPILLLATPSLITPLHTHVALTGRPSYFSILILSLGLQLPLNPSTLSDGEYPACAAMTTGYVFRVENAATVSFLRTVGRTGYLTTIEVSPAGIKGVRGVSLSAFPVIALIAFILYDLASVSTALLLTVSLLLLSRLLSAVSLRACTQPSWHGASEPGVKGDLLVLLSEDRWIRMKGLVDDLKAVTSGSWLSRPRYPAMMGTFDWSARMLVYGAVVVLAGTSDGENFTLVGTVVVSHLILMVENARATELVMNGRTVRLSRRPDAVKQYGRRLEMAQELVAEMGRSDFATRLGMINPELAEESMAEMKGKSDLGNEVVTM